MIINIGSSDDYKRKFLHTKKNLQIHLSHVKILDMYVFQLCHFSFPYIVMNYIDKAVNSPLKLNMYIMYSLRL